MITWFKDECDDEWLGFDDTQDPRTSRPKYIVLSPEPGVWAGWIYTSITDRECITRDYSNPDRVKREIEVVTSHD